MVRRNNDRPPPRLPVRVHHYQRKRDGCVEVCAVCPLPAGNRVHDASVLDQVAAVEAARFGD